MCDPLLRSTVCPAVIVNLEGFRNQDGGWKLMVGYRGDGYVFSYVQYRSDKANIVLDLGDRATERAATPTTKTSSDTTLPSAESVSMFHCAPSIATASSLSIGRRNSGRTSEPRQWLNGSGKKVSMWLCVLCAMKTAATSSDTTTLPSTERENIYHCAKSNPMVCSLSRGHHIAERTSKPG